MSKGSDILIKYFDITSKCKQRGLRPSSLRSALFCFFFIRRLESILEPFTNKLKVEYESMAKRFSIDAIETKMLQIVSPLGYYNYSGLTFNLLINEPDYLDVNIVKYINCFDKRTKSILNNLGIDSVIADLNKSHLLFELTQFMADLDLSESGYSNDDLYDLMQSILSKDPDFGQGENTTPKSLNKLMCKLLYNDSDKTTVSIYDGACGTGGSLLYCYKYFEKEGKKEVSIYGQEINLSVCAIAQALMIVQNIPTCNIMQGNTLIDDCFDGLKFDYVISDSPFGIPWKHWEKQIRNRQSAKFTAGLPTITDGQLLFMQHNISKMKHDGRMICITNGMALSAGSLNSGESDIRKWIIENDLLECVIALPAVLQPRVSVPCFLWILNANKSADRKNNVQLINASSMSLISDKGNRKEICEDDINEIVELYHNNTNTQYSKIISNKELGYLVVYINQPFRNEDGSLINGRLKADRSKTIVEKIPLSVDYDSYLKEKVYPYIDKDSWMDVQKSKIGYEIRFSRFFFKNDRTEGDILQDIANKNYSLRLIMDDILNNQDIIQIACEDSNRRSDVPWIETYPVEWREIKLKFCSEIIPFDSSKTENGDIVLYRNGNVEWASNVKIDNEKEISGLSFSIKANLKYCIPEYLYWILKSELLKKYGQYCSAGYMINYSGTMLGDMTILLPSLSEQQMIVAKLNHKMEQLEQAISLLNSELTDMQTYKSVYLMQELTTKST